MNPEILGALILALALPAQAQDSSSIDVPPGWTISGSTDAMESATRVEIVAPNDAYRFSIGAFGRFSWPFGALDDQDAVLVGNVILIPDHLRYSDLFDTGWGASIEGSFNLFTPDKGGGAPHGPGGFGGGMRAGIYVSIQRDMYEGDRVSEGLAFIDPDDLDLTAGFVGLNVITDMGGGSYGSAHVGVGMARFEQVNARVSLAAGGDDKQELFQASEEFAMEFRYRFTARVGPLGLTGGLGFRYITGPEEGNSNVGDLIDTHPFWTFDVDFGVELGF